MSSTPRWFLGEVTDLRPAGSQMFIIEVTAPLELPIALPGQFAMVRLRKHSTPLLPRPLSILLHSPGKLGFLFKVVGTGTSLLSLASIGEELEISAPLGRAFPSPGALREEHTMVGAPLLIGGGVGIPPMAFYAEKYGGTLLLGAPSLNAVPRISAKWKLATDDGSAGFRGTVVELAAQEIRLSDPCAIMACGPLPMMRAAADLAHAHGIPCYISMETPMACGIGVCHGCAWPAPGGGYVKVCQEGPVFNTKEILL